MTAHENRPPGAYSGQAAKSSWMRSSTREASRSRSANQPSPDIARLALAVQAPADVISALRRSLKRQLTEAILLGDDAATERLRARLDALLNGEGVR
jgi:hypothetical protein